MDELSWLYKIASMGGKPPEALATVLGNGLFGCFAYTDGALVGAGRALADGLDCADIACIACIAVHPGQQGRGLGTAIMRRLLAQTGQCKKVFLLRQAGHRRLLPQARLPAHDHRHGDLGRPSRRHGLRRARPGTR